MNREAFFAAIRPAFGNRMSAPQVAGMEAILDACIDAKVTDVHHVANILGQVRRETGGYMSPIKETVMPYHKDKNPSDAVVIARLDRAWAQGKLGKVKKPYWRTGEFGRGQIQLTHAENRAKFGIKNPDDLLKLDVSARVAVVGMRDGVFRGRKLADYDFPAALEAPQKDNPRRIVNGNDGSDAEVAKFHRQFQAALVKAGWSEKAGKSVAVRESAAPVRQRTDQNPIKKPAAPELTVSTKGRSHGAVPLALGLIVGGYAMGFRINPMPRACRLTVWIDCTLPEGAIGRLFGSLFAGYYARWCVSRMISDAALAFPAASEAAR